MNEAEAHEFYKDPEHLATAGPGRRRERPMKSAMVPVRFSQEMIATVRRFASQDGVTVSTWIRRLVGREIQRRQPPQTSPVINSALTVEFDEASSLRPRSETSSLDAERPAFCLTS
jgi:hypothetical protein